MKSWVNYLHLIRNVNICHWRRSFAFRSYDQNNTFNGIGMVLRFKKSGISKKYIKQSQVNFKLYSAIPQIMIMSLLMVLQKMIEKSYWMKSGPLPMRLFQQGKSDSDIQLIRVICNGAQYWKVQAHYSHSISLLRQQ